MRRMTGAIGTVACLSLLILQLSGAHVHIGAEGYVGVPETRFSHDHGGHDHHRGHHVPDASADNGSTASSESGSDYGSAQDVALLEQTLTAFKIPMAVPALVVLFMVLPLARTLASPDVAYPVLSGRYTRWRPPLRAPPQLA